MSLPLFCSILWLDLMLVKITLMSFHHFFRFEVGCIWGDLGKKSFLDHESRAGINRSSEGLLPFTTIIWNYPPTQDASHHQDDEPFLGSGILN